MSGFEDDFGEMVEGSGKEESQQENLLQVNIITMIFIIHKIIKSNYVIEVAKKRSSSSVPTTKAFVSVLSS